MPAANSSQLLSKNPMVSASSNTTIITLAAIDAIGLVLIFNLNHWLITGAFAGDLLLTWKLVLILAFSFLYYYLMDLYRFDSPLSQLGMLERSFIATLLIGITVALMVYIIGPNFIGGFVGRGVLTSSLLMLWPWSLGIRYLLNAWFVIQQSQIHWLVIFDGDLDQFLGDFRSLYQHEQLLLLSPDVATPDVAPPLTETPEISEQDQDTKWVGHWQDLDRVMEEYAISGIILTSVEYLPESLVNQLMQIRINGTRIYRISDFYEKYLSRIPVFHLNQQWLATAHGFELIHSPIGFRFKRYIDVLISLIGGLIAMPLILATAISIYLTSGGPVFFRQIRTGENNENFTVYKFRSMVVDAEADGAQFAEKNDVRLISIGKTLRKFRLDELPQLWNVLRGEMSFIGPGPERPEFIADLQKNIPYYNLRHVVKPGITGWAQVMTGYGDSTEDAVEKLQYDLFYIKNYSLVLDISILIKSIKVILFGTGR